MKIAWTFLLAVLAAPVHAECAGGVGGGIDATGNECSTYVAGSGINSLAQSDKMSGVHLSTLATAPLTRSAKMSDRSSTPAVVAAPAARMVRAAVPASPPPVKTVKIEIWSEATCSGGADGGMDVNGNQCGQAPAPEGGILVARSKTP